MDWDGRGAVLWLDVNEPQPTLDRFEQDVGSVKWEHAIEALGEVYKRQDDPVPPSTQPWMLWNDGTVFAPGQITAVRPIFEEELAARRN